LTRHDLELIHRPTWGEAFDVNDDGWIDFIAGGAWYENPKSPRKSPFNVVFDPQLNAVHDLISRPRRDKTLTPTMSDRNDLRWYAIPKDERCWPATTIGCASPLHLIGRSRRRRRFDVVAQRLVRKPGCGRSLDDAQMIEP
jgi:hypothetical protein